MRSLLGHAEVVSLELVPTRPGNGDGPASAAVGVGLANLPALLKTLLLQAIKQCCAAGQGEGESGLLWTGPSGPSARMQLRPRNGHARPPPAQIPGAGSSCTLITQSHAPSSAFLGTSRSAIGAPLSDPSAAGPTGRAVPEHCSRNDSPQLGKGGTVKIRVKATLFDLAERALANDQVRCMGSHRPRAPHGWGAHWLRKDPPPSPRSTRCLLLEWAPGQRHGCSPCKQQKCMCCTLFCEIALG